MCVFVFVVVVVFVCCFCFMFLNYFKGLGEQKLGYI